MGIVVLLSVGPTVPQSVGQCPDGSAPPCRRETALARIPIDSNAVAILPFRVSGPPEAQYLREGMMDLLNTALDGFAGWRVVHPRTVLARSSAAAESMDVTAATQTARAVGAGTMILGTAVAVGSELRLRTELYNVPLRRLLGTVRASGDLAHPGQVADSLAAGLARQRLLAHPGAVRRPLAEYTTPVPAALQAYLVAEQLARQSAWQAAAESLEHAIAIDSTFGLAYYRLYLVRMYGGLGVGIGNAAIAGWRLRQRLPPRQRDLLTAARAEQNGLRWEALRAADQLSNYPDDAEAAQEQGEVYFHYGLLVGEPATRPLEAFERALRLDPGLVEPYLHLIELLCLVGDTTEAWAMLGRGLGQSPRSVLLEGLQLAMKVALRHESPVGVFAALPPDQSEDVMYRAEWEVLRILDGDPARAVAFADTFAIEALARDLPRLGRLHQLLMRHALQLAQGQYATSWQILQQATPLAPASREIEATVASHGLITATHRQEMREAIDRLRSGDTLQALNGQLLTAWDAAVAGDTISLATALARYAELGDVDQRTFAEARAAGFRGLAALHRADTTGARRLLVAARDVYDIGPPPHPWHPDAFFSLGLARLERQAGALEDANRTLYDTFLAEALPYRAEAEELRGEIAEQRGDTVAAIRAYRHFVALWKDADPELQPRVVAARAALARLEGR